MLDHIKKNKGKYGALLVGAGAAAGAYYGVPPEVSKPFLEGFLSGFAKVFLGG